MNRSTEQPCISPDGSIRFDYRQTRSIRGDFLMIKKKTLFILGAGAHCSYGFPSGPDLKKEIVGQIQTWLNDRDGIPFSEMGQAGLIPPRMRLQICRDFAESLTHTRHTSVDAFMETHKANREYGRSREGRDSNYSEQI